MLRSIPRALLGVFFIALLMLAAPVAASDDATPAIPVIALQANGAPAEHNQYAGTDGASPLDEVPVVPMVAATAGFLGVLSVVALRRDWLG